MPDAARTAPRSLSSGADPLFYVVDATNEPAPAVPRPRLGLTLRTLVHSLAGMQKEAVVASSAGDRVWRLASDEGPYLAGTDLAPPPLGIFCAGMVAAYATEMLSHAAARNLELRRLRLVQETSYTMEGSALRGTMTGGALAPELSIEADCDLDAEELRALAATAVDTSAVTGLVRGVHESLFTLVHNGVQIATGRVGEVPGSPPTSPGMSLRPAAAAPAEELVSKIRAAEQVEGEGGAGSSLRADQSRTLQVRAVCTIRDDGVKAIDQFLFRPIGSQFRLLSDEHGRAPDAYSLLAAGLGFCFMTQLGRYATITKKRLDGYRIVQDTHFSPTGAPADPVETHVFLDTPEAPDTARQMLDMAEQTCFLHALCRTDIHPQVRVSEPG